MFEKGGQLCLTVDVTSQNEECGNTSAKKQESTCVKYSSIIDGIIDLDSTRHQ